MHLRPLSEARQKAKPVHFQFSDEHKPPWADREWKAKDLYLPVMIDLYRKIEELDGLNDYANLTRAKLCLACGCIFTLDEVAGSPALEFSCPGCFHPCMVKVTRFWRLHDSAFKSAEDNDKKVPVLSVRPDDGDPPVELPPVQQRSFIADAARLDSIQPCEEWGGDQEGAGDAIGYSGPLGFGEDPPTSRVD